ncbi:MAG: biotin synthase BioB [Cyclobacteriaceae bacterium]
MRNDWSKEEIAEIYNRPILELIYEAATVHRQNNDPSEVQVSTLLSIKTGGCPEDCSYCPQAARYNTGVTAHKLLDVDYVLDKATQAKDNGSSRFCMGAAWREVRDNKDFDKVLEMVKGVNAMDMEVCCTLGMITEDQAKKLKEAGLYAYNHNIDTGEDHYHDIITTRKYEDRLDTLDNVRKAEISVCSGGIIGMGETTEDRISMIHTLATMPQHPESVPVNALVAVEGTPLENQPKVPVWDMARMIATARIAMPKAQVRLSAGRVNMSVEDQALCFMAGANSIFAGEELLTTPNNGVDQDKQMFEILGLKPMEAFKNKPVEEIVN